jgi:hypothetical protein
VCALTTIDMSFESRETIGRMSPVRSAQPFGSLPPFCSPPWWTSSTIAFTPCFFSRAA